MDKSTRPYSTGFQRNDFHQGTLRRHRLGNLPHWALEQEQGLALALASVDVALASELEMAEVVLDVVGLVVVVVLVAVPLHQCNPSF